MSLAQLRCKLAALADQFASHTHPDAVRSDAEIKAIALACIEDQCPQTRTLLYAVAGAAGVNVMAWEPGVNPAGGASVESIDDAFTGGATHAPTGLPTHVNEAAPTTNAVITNFDYRDQNIANGQSRVWSYVWVPPGQTWDLRDNDGAVEQGIVHLGACCGSPVEVTRWPYSPPYRAGTFATGLAPGFHMVAAAIHDASAFGGFDVEFSADGGTSWANVPTANLFTECPTVECRPVLVDCEGAVTELDGLEVEVDPAKDFLDCHPVECDATGGAGGGGLSAADVQALIDAAVVPHPTIAVEECDERLCYEQYRGFRGQITPITAVDFTTDILGWIVEGGYTVPCDGDYDIAFDLPWIRTITRDNLHQSYFDVRLMVNGAAAQTLTNYVLIEVDARDVATDNGLDYSNHDINAKWCRRLSAGDVVTVEWRMKARGIQITGANPYNRALVYRSRTTIHGTPNPVVVGVTH